MNEVRKFDDLREQMVEIAGKELLMKELSVDARERYDALVMLSGKKESAIAHADTDEEAEKLAIELAKVRSKTMKLMLPDADEIFISAHRTKELLLELMLLQKELNKDEAILKKLMSLEPAS